MINGRTVTIGEEVDGYQILDIQPDVVTITDGSTIHELRLSP